MKHIGTSAAYISSQKQTYDETTLVDNDLGLYIITDGVSHQQSSWASAYACQIIHEYVKKHLPEVKEESKKALDEGRGKISTLLAHALQLASQALFQESKKDPEKSGVSSTVIAVICFRDFAVIAHLGNPRAYLMRDQNLLLLTKDHTLYQEMADSGEDAFAKINPTFKKVLTKTLGFAEVVHVIPRVVTVSPKDQIVICTDGISVHFSKYAEEIKKINHNTPDPDRFITDLKKVLSQATIKDNGTLVAISISEDETTPTHAGYIGIKDKVECLKSIPLFKGIWGLPDELLKVAGLFTTREAKAGEDIVKTGEQSDEMYITLSGRAESFVGKESVAMNQKYGLIGEMGFLTNQKRSATVKAAEPMKLLVLHRKDFYRLLHQDKDLVIKFAFGVIEELTRKLRANSEILANLKSEKK